VAFVDSQRERDDEHYDAPIEAFLHQPALHAEGGKVDQGIVHTSGPEHSGGRWRRIQRWFTHFMFEKEPSQYSSIAPRTSDGKRTKIFFFNGNGRGR
jgi:hypothetical protein